MVLYKRKPVTFLESSQEIDNNAEVWIMRATEEVFANYEDYLSRYDFLSQKKFTDAVNGKSGMTFFEAVDSENNSSSDIDKLFPDALRDPIFRKVQFSDISRIDELVNYVFDEFRNDYFPSEAVTVILDDGEQLEATIREKAKFPELRAPDGSILRQPFARYFVRLHDQQGDEALVDQDHVKRARNMFTKQNLRSFLKNSLIRETWNGAPWLVKEHLAIRYRLPMEIPSHLRQGARAAEHRLSLPHLQRLSGHFNSVKGRKGKNLTAHDFTAEQLAMQQAALENAALQAQSKPEPKPIPKYPIEDLELPPKHNGTTRPRLKYLAPPDDSSSLDDGLQAKSVGLMLEVWNTLNVQCEAYVLDSFTFDDFVDAMKFSSPDIRCELFEEIHCAVLKQLVDTEGQVQVSLPDMVDEDDEESEDDETEESIPSTPVDASTHATRSRLSQVENISDQVDTPPEHKQRSHRAAELLAEDGWVERLKERRFADGGWQTVMVGLLYQLSLDIRHKQACETILAELVPLDEDPTQRTVRQRYTTLDINLRISALEIITMLSLSTKAIRTLLEDCAEDMTAIRKVKVEHQRRRKELLAQEGRLELERRQHNPDADIQTPIDDVIAVPGTTGNLDDTLGSNGLSASDAEDDVPARPLRRANDRKRKRDEEAARREKERLEKAEAAKVSSDKLKKYKKILKDMEAVRNQIRETEDQIAICDVELREANSWRTRVLGRDRFWNRYYWFERNGMPFGGLPRSSTVEYGYANARIWVQGPDEMEREGFIDLPEVEMQAYYREHHMTVPERKTREEGSTSVNSATEWGYYDDPDSIDALLGWLEEHGKREKDLRKELLVWREDITRQMGKLKDHLEAEKAKKVEAGDEQPVARISTRHKTYVDVETAGQRCLKWHNSFAIEREGHLHSEPPRPKEKRGRNDSRREGRGVAAKVAPASKAAKPDARSTRQTRSGR